MLYMLDVNKSLLNEDLIFDVYITETMKEYVYINDLKIYFLMTL
jgi:hypothetical protein